MPVSGPLSGAVMQKADVEGMHQTLRTLVNDIPGANLGRSAFNYEHLGSLLKASAHADVSNTVSIATNPVPFAQTAANVATWAEPAEYILNAGWVIPKPFLLVEYVTLHLHRFNPVLVIGDQAFWWTLYETNSGGVASVSESHIRFIQAQSMTEAGSGATLVINQVGQTHTLVRRQLFTGTGDFTLNKVSIRAAVADYLAGVRPMDIDDGCIGFYALHVPN